VSKKNKTLLKKVNVIIKNFPNLKKFHVMMINPYSPSKIFTNFADLDARLQQHYDRVFDTVVDYEISPRYFYESGLKIGFRDVFYYIDQLYNTNPSCVIDVGCGECTWKKWFPNIIGFDPNHNEFSQQDFVDFFDLDFSKGHTNWYDSGMALNSLHFVPWDYLPKQIELAMNIVKKHFLFTFNFNMIKNVPAHSSHENLIPKFDQLLQSLDYDIVLLDYPCLRGIPNNKLSHWAHTNGHVRFILSHKK
jgi:hypothetical protein